MNAAFLLACTVCGVVSEEQRSAYLNTTLFLTLLPLVFIGGSALWVMSRHQQAVRGQDAERPHVVPPPHVD